MQNRDKYGIYLHIPYCRARCRYCDFYTAPGARGVPREYVEALKRELRRPHPAPDTLYFGGGTPALLTPAQAAELIAAAGPRPGAEITLEANPDAVTPETLAGFRAAGVNRLSFGVQSARDSQLRTLGRLHTAAGAARALAGAREAGFPDLCGDIMLALPGYTRAEFDETLALLAEGGCTHISAYLLKIEPGTAFAARPGHEGRHNLLYWNCRDYQGIGPAAHSCVGGVRRFWPGDTAGFIAGTAREEEEGRCDAEDFLLMQLRLTHGLDMAEYQARGGAPFTAAQQTFLRQCQAHGYAVWDGRTLRLTPAGMVVQNAILEELI